MQKRRASRLLSRGCPFFLTTPKSAAYRVGISDIPENPYIQAQDLQNSIEETIRKQTQNTTNENRELSYSELSIKNLAKEIAYDL